MGHKAGNVGWLRMTSKFPQLPSYPMLPAAISGRSEPVRHENKFATNVSESLLTLCNEPSVGLYYVQQHYRNAVRPVIELKNKVQETSETTSALTTDASYAHETVTELIQVRHFDGVRSELSRALAAADKIK